MFDAFDEDAAGRFSEERSARILEGVSIGQRAELAWSPDIVKARLSEAIINCERIGGRVGPRNKLTSWVDFRLYKNLDQFDANAQAEGLRMKTRAPDRVRLVLTDRELARMDQALTWMRYVADDTTAAEALKLWMWCEARNQPWSRFGAAICGSRGASNRRLDRALRTIAAGLVIDGVAA